MVQQLIPFMVAGVAWMLLYFNKRSKRTTVGVLAAIGSAIAIATATISIVDRSGVFGFAFGIWALHVSFVVVLVLVIGHLARSLHRVWMTSTLGIGVFWLVVPMSAGELWFGAEEAGFQRDVQARGAKFQIQARAAPFEGSAMVYSNGQYLVR